MLPALIASPHVKVASSPASRPSRPGRRHAIRTLTRPNGPWVVVRRGVYADRRPGRPSTSGRHGPSLVTGPPHLTMTRKHVLSHDSAGRAYGLSTLRTAVPLIHITRPGVGGSRTEHGVKHHLSQGLPWQSSFTSGLPVTPLARTALDIAREHGLWHGVAAIDSALRQGAEHGDFARHLGPMRHWPHVTTARTCLALGDPGAENAGESMARLLLLECDVPRGAHPVPDPARHGARRVGGSRGRQPCRRVRRQRRSTCASTPTTPRRRSRRDRLGGEGARAADPSRGSRRVPPLWSDFWVQRGRRARAAPLRDRAHPGRFGSSSPAHLEDFADRLADVRRRRMAAN